MTESTPLRDYSLFPLGDFALQSGEVIPSASIAYRTYGDASNPTILYPTWYSGTLTAGNEWLISTPGHPRRALDPAKYFIVAVALFGNGESSSPSNHPLGWEMPKATFYDNVRAQHRLLTEGLGVSKIRLVTGCECSAPWRWRGEPRVDSLADCDCPLT